MPVEMLDENGDWNEATVEDISSELVIVHRLDLQQNQEIPTAEVARRLREAEGTAIGLTHG